MTAKDYLDKKNSICDAVKQDCDACPLKGSYRSPNPCFDREYDHPEEMVLAVDRWAGVYKRKECASPLL